MEGITLLNLNWGGPKKEIEAFNFYFETKSLTLLSSNSRPWTDQPWPGGCVHLPNGPPLRHGGEDGPGGDGGLRQRLREALGQLVQQPNGLSPLQ